KRKAWCEVARTVKPATLPVLIREIQQEIKTSDEPGDDRRPTLPWNARQDDPSDWPEKNERRQRHEPAILSDEYLVSNAQRGIRDPEQPLLAHREAFGIVFVAVT